MKVRVSRFLGARLVGHSGSLLILLALAACAVRPRMEVADQLLDRGDAEGARAAYRAVIERPASAEERARAAVALASLILGDAPWVQEAGGWRISDTARAAEAEFLYRSVLDDGDVIEIADTLGRAANNLAVILLATGRRPEALGILERHEKYLKDDSKGTYFETFARAHAAEGSSEKAFRYAVDSLHRRPLEDSVAGLTTRILASGNLPEAYWLAFLRELQDGGNERQTGATLRRLLADASWQRSQLFEDVVGLLVEHLVRTGVTPEEFFVEWAPFLKQTAATMPRSAAAWLRMVDRLFLDEELPFVVSGDSAIAALYGDEPPLRMSTVVSEALARTGDLYQVKESYRAAAARYSLAVALDSGNVDAFAGLVASASPGNWSVERLRDVEQIGLRIGSAEGRLSADDLAVAHLALGDLLSTLAERSGDESLYRRGMSYWRTAVKPLAEAPFDSTPVGVETYRAFATRMERTHRVLGEHQLADIYADRLRQADEAAGRLIVDAWYTAEVRQDGWFWSSSSGSFEKSGTVPVHRIPRVPDGPKPLGPPNAPIEIVAYEDMTSLVSGRLSADMKQLVHDYNGKVNLSIRSFPRLQLIPQSQKAAETALCANELGRYWEARDMLFGMGEEFSTDRLDEVAAAIGVDSNLLSECVHSGRSLQRIVEDLRSGARAGVDSPPAIFVNGRRVRTFRDPTDAQVTAVTMAIDESLASGFGRLPN